MCFVEFNDQPTGFKAPLRRMNTVALFALAEFTNLTQESILSQKAHINAAFGGGLCSFITQ